MPTTTDTGSTIRLPDFVGYCNFPLSLSPHVDACSPGTDQWIASPSAISHKPRVAVTGIKAGLLASMAYPRADLPALRVCADFMHYLFHLDDLTDDMGVKDIKAVADIIMDVLHWPYRWRDAIQRGEAPALVSLTYDLWTRITLTAGPNVQARFIETCDLFFQALHHQAASRAKGVIPDIESYKLQRRDEGAVKPSFVLMEYAAGTDIPEEIMQHPMVKSLENAANDLIVWTNDVFSYNKEQARGDTSNLVLIAMRDKNLNLQDAFDFVGELCKETFDRFELDRTKLPSWDPDIDRDVDLYVRGLADWVVGSLHWSFESHRYFGTEGQSIKVHRSVKLLPKRIDVAGRDCSRGQYSL